MKLFLELVAAVWKVSYAMVIIVGTVVAIPFAIAYGMASFLVALVVWVAAVAIIVSGCRWK